jgi:hypothetical protein
MATKLATKIKAGDIIELDKRHYQVTTVTINWGGLGDYVTLELFDINRERWIVPASYDPNTKFNVVKKGK